MCRWFIVYVPTAFLTLLPPPANAQPASFQGPLGGFVFSAASKTVRPLLGIPGAMHVDAPILNRVDSASIAPGGQWGFVTRAGHTTFVRGLSDLAPAESSIDGLMDAADRVVWSRDGTFALLYSSSGSRLQRVQLSGSKPLADAPIDLSPWGQVTTLAIDPAGEQIAVGFAASGIYLFTTGQSPALLVSMAHPAAAAFDGTGNYLFAIDPRHTENCPIPIRGRNLGIRLSGTADGPALHPAGMAVSGNGLYLVLADSASRSVLVYETNSRSLADTIPLNFAPSRFEALSAGPVLLLNGNDPKEWLSILDARQTPTVYIVPASAREL